MQQLSFKRWCNKMGNFRLNERPYSLNEQLITERRTGLRCKQSPNQVYSSTQFPYLLLRRTWYISVLEDVDIWGAQLLPTSLCCSRSSKDEKRSTGGPLGPVSRLPNCSWPFSYQSKDCKEVLASIQVSIPIQKRRGSPPTLEHPCTTPSTYLQVLILSSGETFYCLKTQQIPVNTVCGVCGCR